MIIKEVQVYGIQQAVLASRNPMDSWDKSDSRVGYETDLELWKQSNNYTLENFVLGVEDERLSKQLTKAGTEHCKHLRMIQVWATIEAPRYIWQEFDTYRFLEKVSCSTMHKLFNKQRSIRVHDFSFDEDDIDLIVDIVNRLNEIRGKFLIAEGKEKTKLLIRAKKILPESFLQKRTINTTYQQLLNIYKQRKNHKLPEWHTFCDWVVELPYFKELTGIK